jgi:spore germination protein
VSALVRQLRRLDPPGEIVIDTYAGSAGTAGFFDVRALAPLADEVFLMAYDLYSPFNASANSPLASPTLGYSVIQSLIQYEKVMPADKIVLGVPLYGEDFRTAGAKPGAVAVSSAPEAFGDSAIAAAGYPARWDVASDTPYSVFRRAGVWHQIWFDDAVSLALKTAAASELRVAGVGAWAFGMEGTDSELLVALDGGAAPLRASLSPPP